MKMNEPIGNGLYGPLFIRVTLGAYFVVAGMLKLDQAPGAFIEEVRQFGILKEPLLTLYATLLPYLEVMAGGLMILGFFTTLAALTSSLLLISYIVAFKLFPQHPHLFNKDVVLLGASLSLLFSGGGYYSVDNFRKTG